MIFVVIGVALVYISSVVMVLTYLRERRKLMWLDWVAAFIPFLREVYMMVEVDLEDDTNYDE
jgi:hypothetical protein